MNHLKAINKYFWKYRWRLGVGVCFIVISNYFGVLAPQITGYIIGFAENNLTGNGAPLRQERYDWLVLKFIDFVEKSSFSPMGIVVLAGFTILALALLRGFFMFLMRQTIIVMSRHIEFDQKNEVFNHYQQLDASFYKTHSTGDLMSRMAEDVSRVRMFTGPAIMYFINLATLISLSVFFMYHRQPQLTLYVLSPLPILAIIIYAVNNIIHRKSEALQSSLAGLTTNAQQSYSGIRVIKSFVQEKAMLGYFERNSESYKQQATSLAKVEALYFPSMTLLIGLSTLLTIMIGGMYYIDGTHNINIATIVEFVIYINMLTFPVSAIGWTASMIQRAAASQKRLNEFLQTKPLIQNAAGAVEKELSGDIQLHHVSFTYSHTGIKAVDGVSLHIRAGQRVAIVGRTGSGKTTLAQLIMRMYDVDEGTVSMDGTDVRNIQLASLRKQISYVPQDGFLFSDTVENNIAFGAVNTSAAAVKEAAKMAVVAADIEGFAQQYQTQIGERGVTLSGGQKQRISIARALMKEAPIMILDDCLSAVDARTERQIIHHLQTALEGRTAILITHRIFSLLAFDQIVVMDEGRIAELGTHTELMKQKGLYYEMHSRQQKESPVQGGGENLAV